MVFVITNKDKFSKAASVQDTAPPWDAPLSAKYMRSFAYVTVKDRLPVILTKVIDGLSRDKESIAAVYGEEGKEDVKRVISCLSQLKNEMVTDKYFTQLVCGEDASKWNIYWRNKTENGTTVSWYKTEWLYAECYLYRRIKEAFLLSKKLGDYDPFHKQKTEAVEEALHFMDAMAIYLVKLFEDHDIRWDAMHSDFQRVLKHSLWANRVDLSMSSGNHVEVKGDPFKLLDEFDEFILIDNSHDIWVEISKSSIVKDLIIDIVLDNTGLELMMDLCLADYLTSMYNAVRVRFHCKAIPWFVSDVMEKDFHQVIERLSNHTPACQQLTARWHDYLDHGKWSVHSEPFWTLPFSYNEMKEQDPKLHSMLAESSIIIFKGDLNYRKLLGDINWKYTTPFHAALRGFNPAPIVALRTAKADLIAGLDPYVFEPVAAKNRNWLLTGDYGLIQFDGTNSKNNLESEVSSEIKKLAL
ncbi:damage-control phosphatase ARMT1-like isoform X1 [Macrosteles quadrilineatus]|uniref:damage-control phosphatase ARMT1-like isoform X1 n=1 Tax=Macrosteles quadrilineatus TaxID=74068 RepID=UPI0023E2D419|nr:damage-control phosphatase ARMT1-like isoform X1 [Macrosteles quadrilineatus]